MKLTSAIDVFVEDLTSQGRMTSSRTEATYRSILKRHAEDVGNRDPRTIGREDVKRTLRRWSHPNSQRTARAILVSFYDYLMEEGWRADNPARQTRRPRRKPPSVYRLTREEVVRLLGAAQGERERRVIFLGVLAGLRRAEIRGLQGRHFGRPGYVWISADIAKGGKERFVPVAEELEVIFEGIRSNTADDEYVLPAQRWRNPPVNSLVTDLRHQPCSPQALYRLVLRVGERAGIAAPVHPHLMRHAYADFIARHAGIRNAQFLLGHAGVGTTETYLGRPTLDELSAAVKGFAFGLVGYPPSGHSGRRLERDRGIEPVLGASNGVERNLAVWVDEQVARAVEIYAPHFERLAQTRRPGQRGECGSTTETPRRRVNAPGPDKGR
jgi:site-specific recombinase XerD